MEANIISVGNSKGIIIPSEFLKLLALTKKVHIAIKNNKIVISSVKKPIRDGWGEMFMNDLKANGQPEKLLPDFFEDENLDSWTW